MLGDGEAYCTGCGKPRRIVSIDAAVREAPARTDRIGFFAVIEAPKPTPVDPRYPTVLCGSKKRPGVFDAAKAKAIIKARRARRKARRITIEATYKGLGEGQRKVALTKVR
jgi:hypothetical protein